MQGCELFLRRSDASPVQNFEEHGSGGVYSVVCVAALVMQPTFWIF